MRARYKAENVSNHTHSSCFTSSLFAVHPDREHKAATTSLLWLLVWFGRKESGNASSSWKYDLAQAAAASIGCQHSAAASCAIAAFAALVDARYVVLLLLCDTTPA